MDFFDWYFKQVVTQGQMDWAFAEVETAIDRAAADPGLTGILDGLGVAEHAPTADLTVDVAAGVAYDADGQRIGVPDALTVVDCSVDEYGVPTDPPTPTFQRYLSIFAAFDRELTDPAVDGNGVTVYTHHLEAFRLFVRQGAEAAPGGAVRPALLPDALLLADVLITSGQTAILTAHLDTTRRQDWLRAWADPGLGFVAEWLVHGQPAAAIEDVWRRWNEHVSDLAWFHAAGVVAYTPGQTWYGGETLDGAAPPVADVAEALDAILYDLAAARLAADPTFRVGASLVGAHGYSSTYVGWGIGATVSVQEALEAIGAALDGHIGGSPPAHPATAVTFTETPYLYPWFNHAANVQQAVNAIAKALQDVVPSAHGSHYVSQEAIAGSPEAFAPPAPGLVRRVHEAIEELFGHVNDRTERATQEQVSAAWGLRAPHLQIIPGGMTQERWATRALYPLNVSEQFVQVHSGRIFGSIWDAGGLVTDLCDGVDPDTLKPRGLAVGPSLGSILAIDPYSDAGTPWTAWALAATVHPIAVCQLGDYFYVLGTKTGSGTVAHVWQYNARTFSPVSGPFNGVAGLQLTGLNLDTTTYRKNRIGVVYAGAASRLFCILGGELGSGQPFASIDIATGTYTQGRGTVPNAAGAVLEGGLAIAAGWAFVSFYDSIALSPYIGVVEVNGCGIPERYTGHNWHNYGYTDPPGDHCYDLAFDGQAVWAITDKGGIMVTDLLVSSQPTVADGACWSHEATLSGAAGSTGDTCRIAFDGLHVWAKCPHSSNRHFVSRFAPDALMLGDPAVAIAPAPHWLHHPAVAGFLVSDTQPGRMVVLGDALWGVLDEADNYLVRTAALPFRT